MKQLGTLLAASALTAGTAFVMFDVFAHAHAGPAATGTAAAEFAPLSAERQGSQAGGGATADAGPASALQPASVGAFQGELAHSYSSIAELARNATIVAIVEITSTTTLPFEQLVFTLDSVRVVDSLRGSAPNGSTLTVLETGGLLPAASAKGVPQSARAVEVSFDGVPVAHRGERYLVFLEPYRGPVAPTGSFVILGVYQGKLLLDSTGQRVQPTTTTGQLTGPEFAVYRAASGRSIQDVIAEARKGF